MGLPAIQTISRNMLLSRVEALVGDVPLKVLPTVISHITSSLMSFPIAINGERTNDPRELLALITKAKSENGQLIVRNPRDLANTVFGIFNSIGKEHVPDNTNAINISSGVLQRYVKDEGLRQALYAKYLEATKTGKLALDAFTKKASLPPVVPNLPAPLPLPAQAAVKNALAIADNLENAALDLGNKVLSPVSLLNSTITGYVEKSVIKEACKLLGL